MSKKFKTQEDVAAEVGVSPMTVSRVINCPEKVNKNTKQKVEKAMKKLHYYSSSIAQKLRTGGSFNVSIIVPDIGTSFYINIIENIEKVLREKQIETMILNSNANPELEKKHLDYSLSNRIDALIISPTKGNLELIKRIHSIQIPIVILENFFKEIKCDYVLQDNFNGMRLLTEHLVKKHKHKRIGYLSYYPSMSNALKRRLDGYLKAINDNGLQVCEDLLLFGEADIETGYELVQKVIKKNITALLSATIAYEIGILEFFNEEKINIPEDVAFATFFEQDINRIYRPPITSLKSKDTLMGKKAAEIIIRKLLEKKPFEQQKVKFPAKLILRESCGCQFDYQRK